MYKQLSPSRYSDLPEKLEFLLFQEFRLKAIKSCHFLAAGDKLRNRKTRKKRSHKKDLEFLIIQETQPEKRCERKSKTCKERKKKR